MLFLFFKGMLEKYCYQTNPPHRLMSTVNHVMLNSLHVLLSLSFAVGIPNQYSVYSF